MNTETLIPQVWTHTHILYISLSLTQIESLEAETEACVSGGEGGPETESFFLRPFFLLKVEIFVFSLLAGRAGAGGEIASSCSVDTRSLVCSEFYDWKQAHK